MVRKISSDKYVIAGIITFLIFALGVTLGLVFEDYRYNVLEDVNDEQEIKYLSLQLQYLFINSEGDSNCPILATTLKETVTDLSDSLSEVISYEEEKKVTDKKKISIQRRYALDNIRYWLLATQSKKRCDLDIVPILYFYTQGCSSCPNQGTVLTYFKKVFGEKVLVFPINLELREKEPMVEIIIKRFNVTKYPTIVIDEQKYEGVVQQDELQEVICKSLTNAPECS